MKILFILITISGSLLGQSKELKHKNYSHLDTIDVYSKDYPTKLVEGSGLIKNKKNRNVGAIGFSIKITKDSNGKIIRILKSESNHYIKDHKNPQKSIIREITIYYDDSQPDLAKYTSETLINNSLVKTETKLFDLKQNNNDLPGFKNVKDLLDMIKNEDY
ncbi:hypothetical protein MTQ00_06910 [Chryseobacterium sp. B21-037]|uniref:hypothetical protein n=2 Tax=Chryseobacterium TaxID=59732 RepID=UPI00235998ED|nr:hypothetical protein [Chryseobacterium sp. B21-037]MDC8104268.1 hypothetical protein [Chryseobacterium sp. B21-037]